MLLLFCFLSLFCLSFILCICVCFFLSSYEHHCSPCNSSVLGLVKNEIMFLISVSVSCFFVFVLFVVVSKCSFVLFLSLFVLLFVLSHNLIFFVMHLVFLLLSSFCFLLFLLLWYFVKF